MFSKNRYSRSARVVEFGELMRIQTETNTAAMKDWKKNPPNYVAAALVEAGETLEHLDFKWWKGRKAYSQPNLAQARMEMVDILHFLISDVLANYVFDTVNNAAYEGAEADRMQITAEIFSTVDEATPEVDVETAAEHLMNCIGFLALNPIDIDVWKSWMAAVNCLGMTWSEVYGMYVGKAALNRFRWSNGYGSDYVKEWDGREDNEYLTEIIAAYRARNVQLDLDLLMKTLNINYKVFAQHTFSSEDANLNSEMLETETGKVIILK